MAMKLYLSPKEPSRAAPSERSLPGKRRVWWGADPSPPGAVLAPALTSLFLAHGFVEQTPAIWPTWIIYEGGDLLPEQRSSGVGGCGSEEADSHAGAGQGLAGGE